SPRWHKIAAIIFICTMNKGVRMPKRHPDPFPVTGKLQWEQVQQLTEGDICYEKNLEPLRGSGHPQRQYLYG
ncbi:MAG TPA: hypothetical protein H9745_07300, partial [Candidatus Agathobaculum stercoravium]|nr:hypothetical protein [Candidatus Agathobaculum stercoravium]